MDIISLDPISICIAALSYLVIHYVWNSSWLFAQKSLPVIFQIPVALVYSYFLSFFESYLNVASVLDGMFTAFCIWLGFVVTTTVANTHWTRKSGQQFFIQIGVKLLALLAMGGIIGA